VLLKFVVAPVKDALAVRVAPVPAEHIVFVPAILTVGVAFTVITCVEFDKHPSTEVTFTLYVMFPNPVGVADTADPDVEAKPPPAEDDHVNVLVAALVFAEKDNVEPAQILDEGEAVIVGVGVGLIVIEKFFAELLHPLCTAVTVNTPTVWAVTVGAV